MTLSEVLKIWNEFPKSGSGTIAYFKKCDKCGNVDGNKFQSFHGRHGVLYFFITTPCKKCHKNKCFNRVYLGEASANYPEEYHRVCGI